MMQSPQTILREWLANHPGDFTLREACEKVGTAGPFPTGERAQYHVGVWRAVQ